MNLHFTIMKHLHWLLFSALAATCSAETQNQAKQTQYGHLFASKVSDDVERRQLIKVICKGTKTLEREARGDKVHEEFKVVTMYIISSWPIQSTNLHEWVIQVNDSELLQYEFFSDQSRGSKPFSQSSVVVNENQIEYTLYSSHESDANVNYASKRQRLLKINRLTGEWYEHFERTTKWSDGRKLNQTDTTVGSCEKAAQKF